MPARDEFTAATVGTLARRVAYRCSIRNAELQRAVPIVTRTSQFTLDAPLTSRQLHPEDHVTTRVCLLMNAWRSKMESISARHVQNWIDSDASRFTVDLLRHW